MDLINIQIQFRIKKPFPAPNFLNPGPEFFPPKFLNSHPVPAKIPRKSGIPVPVPHFSRPFSFA